MSVTLSYMSAKDSMSSEDVLIVVIKARSAYLEQKQAC